MDLDTVETVLQVRTQEGTGRPLQWARRNVEWPESVSIHASDKAEVDPVFMVATRTVVDVVHLFSERIRLVVFEDVSEDYIETLITRTEGRWKKYDPVAT